MAKPTEEGRNPRLLRRGDVVRVNVPGVEEPVEEVLRGVSFILHLGNGTDVHVNSEERVTVVPPEDLSEVADEVQAIATEEKGQ